MKKAKKHIGDIADLSLSTSGISIGVGALGGSTAPMQNVSRRLPAAGSILGAGIVIGEVQKLGKKMKKKKGKKPKETITEHGNRFYMGGR